MSKLEDVKVQAMPMSLHEYNDRNDIKSYKNDQEGYLVINSLDKEMWIKKDQFECLFKGLT